MSDNKHSGVPFESDDPAQRQLWQELQQLPHELPSARLRQEFYGKLYHASRPNIFQRLGRRLGLDNRAALTSAFGCLVVGLALGVFSGNGASNGASQLAALEQQVAILNRNLILDRLENEAPGKRLDAAISAGEFALQDKEIVNALMAIAVQDPVHSVRAAAIQALGSHLDSPAIGDRLMTMLQQDEPPLVQLAIAEMVLRRGSAMQLQRLIELCAEGELNADLSRYVNNVVRQPLQTQDRI